MDLRSNAIPPACEQYELQMENHLEGELDSATARNLERHIAACSNCSDAFEAAQAGARLFEAAGTVLETSSSPGPEFARLVMAQVRVEKDRRVAERQSFWQPIVVFGWRFAATAMVALLILLTYAVRGRSHSREVVGPIGQTQVVDVFAPDPTRTPANQDEVLLLMSESAHANH